MKINLVQMDKKIAYNKIPEVTNPVYFEKGGYPTPDGLFSNEIFGTTLAERKRNFAYINLRGHFLHPEVYKLIKRMDSRINKIILGLDKYKIEDGDLIQDANGGTGLEWLYKNWKKIDFKRNESRVRDEKIDLLTSHPVDTLFVTKWLVIPPFTRDANTSANGQLEIHEINRLYSQLIRQTSLISSQSELGVVIYGGYVAIQETLVNIYDHFKGRLSGKYGVLKKNIMAKNVTNAGISVITNPRFKNIKKIDEEYISVRKVGVPLSQILTGFTPFIIHHIRKFIVNEIELNQNKMPIKRKDGSEEFVQIVDPLSTLTEEYIVKRINLFNNTTSSRFDKVKLPAKTKDGEIIQCSIGLKMKMIFDELNTSSDTSIDDSSIFNRPLTWMDLFYIAAEESVNDKHVNIVRHPVLDSFAGFNASPRILTTMETIEVMIDDKYYPYYPKVKFDLTQLDYDLYFQDTVQFTNVFAPAMVADYDGDTIINKGMWSQQANITAAKLIESKNAYIGIDGVNRRVISNESVQALYNFTKADGI